MDYKELSWNLIYLAIFLQVIGGLMDIYHKKKICYKKYCITKKHLWKNSIFILFIVISMNIIS
jgi:hypothetical protein